MNKILICLLLGATFIALWSFFLNVDQQWKTVEVVLPKTEKPQKISPEAQKAIAEHLDTCRSKVSEHVMGDARVLSKFDDFSALLQNSYLNGSSLIEKDIHFIIDSIQFASEAHLSQTRKNPGHVPYIAHPIGVAEIILSCGGVHDFEIIAASVLHGVIEDTTTTYEDIQNRFGTRVANFVKEVSDDHGLKSQERRKQQIARANEKSAGAAQIMLADKIYNLADLHNNPPIEWSDERIDAYFRWAQSVIENLPWVNKPLKVAADDIIAIHWACLN